MTSIVLAGNGITANVLAGYLKNDSRYNIVGCVADDEHFGRSEVEDFRLIRLSELQKQIPTGDCHLLMAVGYSDLNRGRELFSLRLKDMGYTIETYIHPSAQVHTENPLGDGCVVLPGTVIEPHCTIGANTMIWCNTTIAHHSSVAENCWIASGSVISGQAKVLRNTFLGVNATVVNGVTVGEYNIVGAAAMISKDTKAHSVYLARSAEHFRYSSEDYVKHFGGLV